MNIDKMPAGKNLDVLVAEKVMGHKPYDEWKYSHKDELVSNCEHSCYPRNNPPNYSTHIAAAWQAVFKVRELKAAVFSLDCLSPTDDYWQATFKSGLDMEQARFDRLDYAFADTPELAICRTALKTVKAQASA